ncbi:MAG: hypothetical protein AB7O78_01865 [Thermoleophilia bacterium]
MRDGGTSARALVARVRRRPGRAPLDPRDALAARLALLNPGTLARATGHPVILHRHLTAVGLPVPRLHGVVGRAGGWSAAGARPVIGRAEAARFLAGLPGDIRLQPNGGAARVVGRDGGDGDLDALVAELFAPGGPDLVVVQESRGLGPPARVVTAVGDDGVPRVAHRCAATDAAADALACRAATVLMPQRALAWEIAASADGPVILSADGRWEGAPGLDAAAALAALDAALAQGMAA